LSINRFERKKGIGLAIEAFARVLDEGGLPRQQGEAKGARLVIAGGDDRRGGGKGGPHQELGRPAQAPRRRTRSMLPGDGAGAETDATAYDVLFLASFTEAQRSYLLRTCAMLLYTPDQEHFGIVPVEAMYARVPVVAVNSGGPTESILDGATGYLVP